MELGQETKDDEGGRTPSSGVDDGLKEVLRDCGSGSGSDDEGTRQPYNCIFCRRGFPTAQALGGHMNVHRKDRPGRASTPTTVAAARGACSYYEPTMSTTLVDASTGYGWDSHRPARGAGRSLLIHAERAPQELRLFGRDDGATGRGEEGGGARDRRDGNDDDHGEEGEEELDLELRLGAAGQ